MSIIDFLRSTISGKNHRVVFPEGDNADIIAAATSIALEKIAMPILLGRHEAPKTAHTGIKPEQAGPEVINPSSSSLLPGYIDTYSSERDMPVSVGKRIITHPLYFGAMMVKQGQADAMVAGITHATEEVIMASDLIIGKQKGLDTISSFFIMEIPAYSGEEGNALLFADPAVNPDPSPEELADIAIASAWNAQTMLGWEPRVAMLSFSTHGSAVHPKADKVIRATEIVRGKAPSLLVDGELQLDAAIDPNVARKKVKHESPVAGRANVLVFPDLNAANIGAKLVAILACGTAYGPILQGTAKPVSDLSRGATAEDVVRTTIMTLAQRCDA